MFNYQRQLAQAGLAQGNISVVELAYQRVKDFEALSFLYMLSGNFEKLRKMIKIAELREDYLSVFHNSLYLGDIEEQIKVLQGVGQCKQGPICSFKSWYRSFGLYNGQTIWFQRSC